MIIKPSAAIRNNYNEISEYCKKTGEPIFLTKNGEGDLVVLSIESYEKREKLLKIKEELLKSEEDRISGKTYSIDEVDKILSDTIKGVADNCEEYKV